MRQKIALWALPVLNWLGPVSCFIEKFILAVDCFLSIFRLLTFPCDSITNTQDIAFFRMRKPWTTLSHAFTSGASVAVHVLDNRSTNSLTCSHPIYLWLLFELTSVCNLIVKNWCRCEWKMEIQLHSLCWSVYIRICVTNTRTILAQKIPRGEG